MIRNVHYWPFFILLIIGCAAADLGPCKVCSSIRDLGCPVILANPEKVENENARTVALEYCRNQKAGASD